MLLISFSKYSLLFALRACEPLYVMLVKELVKLISGLHGIHCIKNTCSMLTFELGLTAFFFYHLR